MSIRKRSIVLIVAFIFVFNVFGHTLALSNNETIELANQFETPNGIDEDQWADTKAAPTSSTSLPYTAKGTISSSVYTKYYFHPSSSGYLYTTLNGSLSWGTGTAKVTIKLYKVGQSGAIESHTYPAATSWSNLSLQWGGGSLDPSAYYYYKISKNNNLLNHLTFTLVIRTTSS